MAVKIKTENNLEDAGTKTPKDHLSQITTNSDNVKIEIKSEPSSAFTPAAKRPLFGGGPAAKRPSQTRDPNDPWFAVYEAKRQEALNNMKQGKKVNCSSGYLNVGWSVADPEWFIPDPASNFSSSGSGSNPFYLRMFRNHIKTLNTIKIKISTICHFLFYTIVLQDTKSRINRPMVNL